MKLDRMTRGTVALLLARFVCLAAIFAPACSELRTGEDSGVMADVSTRADLRADAGSDVAAADAGSLRRTDAGPVAPDDEIILPPLPDTILATFLRLAEVCEVAGAQIPFYGTRVLDDCVVCQCTSYGGRCSRRVGCERDVCVFADGTTALPGETARVHGCFVCRCDDEGGVCVRDTMSPCPSDGCLVPYFGTPPSLTIAFGDSRMISECHDCVCDEVTGTACQNICHPYCFPPEGPPVNDQDRVPHPSGCGSCVCDNGDLACDRRGCGD